MDSAFVWVGFLMIVAGFLYSFVELIKSIIGEHFILISGVSAQLKVVDSWTLFTGRFLFYYLVRDKYADWISP